jgi:vacuolar-type H+-ATPase subunit F/Vma7
MPIKIDHPYRGLTKGQWLRGNLHTHTTLSDGDRTPQRTVNDYAARGYDFLAITDHDMNSTTAQLRKLNNKKALLLIPGNEVSRNGPHIVHVGADRFAEPHPQRQRVINEINKGSGLSIIAHPNWLGAFDGTTIGQLNEWIDYTGLEIFNGLIGRLPGTRYCTNKWDLLLSRGHRVWGFANDDTHADLDAEQGWNVVYTRERTVKAVLAALKAGKFYCSSGVAISRIQVRGTQITIETDGASRIVAVGDSGSRLATVDSDTMVFDVPESPGFTYVRFECWGNGEKMAWTQPFWIQA